MNLATEIEKALKAAFISEGVTATMRTFRNSDETGPKETRPTHYCLVRANSGRPLGYKDSKREVQCSVRVGTRFQDDRKCALAAASEEKIIDALEKETNVAAEIAKVTGLTYNGIEFGGSPLPDLWDTESGVYNIIEIEFTLEVCYAWRT